MQKILTILLMAFTAIGYSQSITIKGTVTDPDNLPLEAATVYLSNAKDSTLIEYTITDSRGQWQLKTRAISQPVNLKVSFIGFSTYQKQLQNLTRDTDIGAVKLEDKGTDLKEVVIEGEVPPVRVKQDTLEFDAASFKVRPDANVQTLLKQLPGVVIDDTGKITVNGKEVNQILVNGKPFFDKDGKIALQSLPADIINKVQVTDTKTRKEELAKQKASGDNSTINFTIAEDKNKGMFGKVTGGYGSDDRYEANALVNYFKGKRKVSILASSNNINSTGFSNDDIFDSMGGGRNMQVWNTGDGGAMVNGVRVGGGSGITTTNILGLNYADEWGKGVEPSLNYFYTSSDTKNDNRSRSETFLPDGSGSIITNSSGKRNGLSFSNNVNTQFRVNIDSTSTLFFEPKFTRTNNKNQNISQQVTTDQDDELLNESNGFTLSDSDNSSFNSNLNYSKIFNKRGRSLDVEFSNSNSLNDGINVNDTRTRFYEDANNDGLIEIRDDNRNQKQVTRQSNDNYTADISYTEPVTDSLEVQVGSMYAWRNNVENNKGYDYDQSAEEYSDLNELITNYYSSTTSQFNPYASLHIKKKKIDIRGTFGTNIYSLNNIGEYRGERYGISKDFVLPSTRANFRYRFERGKSFYINYNFDASMPSARQMLPIEDVSNALNTIIGNENLTPAKTHRLYFSYNNYDWASRSGYYIYGGTNIREAQIANSTIIGTDAKRTTTYENIRGGYSTWFGGNFNKSIKTEAGNTWRYTLSLNSSYNLDKGFTNGVLYSAKSLNLTPSVNFAYELGELLTINPSYSYTINDARYTNFNRNSASNFLHKAALTITNYWPKHFVMGNDLSYSYNSQIASGYKKDFFLWNTSIGYSFLQDKMTFKVKVYDLLNQNLGTSRTITPNGIYDVENTVLRRYVMFSLTYKINQFGDKKGNGPGGSGRGRMRMRP